MDAPQNAPEARDPRVRLSAAQKRDLLGQGVAAVITSALMVAPFVVPHRVEHARVEEGIVAVAAPPSLAAPAPLAADVSVPHRPTRSLLARRVRVEPAVIRVDDVTAKKDPARRALARRLAGLLTGDGSYSVRPFPTVAVERQ